MFYVRDRRIELLSHPWQGRVLPLNQSRIFFVPCDINIEIDFVQKKNPENQGLVFLGEGLFVCEHKEPLYPLGVFTEYKKGQERKHELDCHTLRVWKHFTLVLGCKL